MRLPLSQHRHETATAPATEARNRTDHGTQRYRRGCVRLLRPLGLAVPFRLTTALKKGNAGRLGAANVRENGAEPDRAHWTERRGFPHNAPPLG
jgi:hypothetical protein